MIFKIGDRVQFKEWDEMVAEYGVYPDGDIRILPSFVKEMRHLCGTYATIEYICGNEIQLKDFTAHENTDWQFSEEMLKPADDSLPVVLDEGAFAPTRAHEWDAGMDIYSPMDRIIPARDSIVIDTGVHIAIPEGYVGMLKSKSGLNVKHGITSEGVIDAHYTGSICVKLYNNSERDYVICKRDKITQLVIMPVLIRGIKVVERLDDTDRGENGFGSTGR